MPGPYYFVIESGSPGYLPDWREPCCFETLSEARQELHEALEIWCEDGLGHKALDFHPETFGREEGDASQWHWIMAFANGSAEELRLVGLTSEEWAQEQGQEP